LDSAPAHVLRPEPRDQTLRSNPPTLPPDISRVLTGQGPTGSRRSASRSPLVRASSRASPQPDPLGHLMSRTYRGTGWSLRCPRHQPVRADVSVSSPVNLDPRKTRKSGWHDLRRGQLSRDHPPRTYVRPTCVDRPQCSAQNNQLLARAGCFGVEGRLT